MLRAGTGLIENVIFWASLGSIVCFTRRATTSIPSREGLTQEIPIRGQNFAFGPISPAGAPGIKRDPNRGKTGERNLFIIITFVLLTRYTIDNSA